MKPKIPSLKTKAKRMMEHLCCLELPDTATELAEITAIEMCNDQWLDDPGHWIWEIALQKYNEFYQTGIKSISLPQTYRFYKN